ncbi:hypothetical protein C0J52_23342 [Blattella germanica]|nr:hypothetical protein C0J52_23342 [Blattella germanica]
MGKCAAQQLNASQSTHRFSFVNHTIKTVNMPKVRHSVNLKSKLTSYISEFKEDGLSTDNKILFCNLCHCAVSSTQKFLVQQHITTSKHQANKQLNSKQHTFSCIIKTLKSLQNRHLSLSESFEIINSTVEQLNRGRGKVADAVRAKVDTVLSKNPGYEELQKVVAEMSDIKQLDKLHNTQLVFGVQSNNMPKLSVPLRSKLQNYVNTYGSDVFSTDGVVLACKICEQSVNYEKKYFISQHINTTKHKNALSKVVSKNKISLLPTDEAASIRAAKKLLDSPEVKNDITFIAAHFGFLPEMITRLEERGQPLLASMKIVESVVQRLESVPGEKGLLIKGKCERVLSQNSDLDTLRNISKILNGDNSVQVEMDPSVLLCFRFAPITSVDVERSFSQMKNVLNDRRHNMTVENLKKHLVVMCNQ